MKIIVSLALLSGLLIASVAQGQAPIKTQVIAHRGYWKTEGSAQNSLAALRKADSIRCFGSECDVWLCADGALLVEHDMTVDIQGQKAAMEETPSTQLREYVLPNGERMPTFEEYLQMMKKCRHTKLIVELKSAKTGREAEHVARSVEAIRKAKLEKRVEYIAFSRRVCEELIAQAPGAKVAYLNGDLTPAEAKAMGLTGIDYHEGVFKKHPEWISEAQALGLEVNVWTVNDPEAMRWFAGRGVDYITTDEPVQLQEILNAR